MKKSILIISHFLFWVFNALAAPYMFLWAFFFVTHAIQHPKPAGPFHSYHYEIDYPAVMIFTAVSGCIFYASYFSLNFFLKRPWRFIGIAAFYTLCMLIISLPADLVSQTGGMYLGPVLYFNISGFLFRACVEWVKDRQLKAELEKDRERSQLELLKSKIDPHFLFNNLNNIDVFIQEDPTLASEYMKKLSDILRFMLYEAGSEKIPLATEIEYIKKYIDLQKIRTANANFVKFEINSDIHNKYISPMILIHFIENAFKYASNKKIEDAVVVKFDLSEKQLLFFCKNHIYKTKELGSEKNGLGTHLLKQKLDLLYKKNYKLVTKEENNWYIVSLEIQLDEN